MTARNLATRRPLTDEATATQIAALEALVGGNGDDSEAGES